MLYNFYKFICWCILKIIFRLKVIGRENIPQKEAVMLVANHVSFLDPVVIGVSCSRTLCYFAQSDLFRLPFLGRLIWSVNVTPINRQKLELSVLRRVYKLVKRKKAFVVFPEGTRSKTGEIQPGKPGLGLIVWRTRVKVIPALIKGTDKALPVKARFIRPAKIKVIIGKPLNLTDFYNQPASKDLYQEIVDRMMSAIKDLGR